MVCHLLISKYKNMLLYEARNMIIHFTMLSPSLSNLSLHLGKRMIYILLNVKQVTAVGGTVTDL